MSSGLILKKKLNLYSFKHVRIRRLITGGSLRCYQVVFDSRNPQRPLTTFLLNHNVLMPRIVDGTATNYYALPWADLEVFGGNLEPAIYFVSDVAGFYGKPDNYSERCFELKSNKLEELTIQDLRKTDEYTSGTTQKYKDIRKDFQGQGIKNTKLMDAIYIKDTGSLRFVFLAESTETVGKDGVSHTVAGEKKKQFDHDQDKLVDNPSSTYDMYLQLENIFPNNYYEDISWLEVYNSEEVDAKMMKELLEVADVKLFDNTPAFQYQGFAYRLSTIDSAVYPESRPDTFWRKKHGNSGLLDKHFSQLLDSGTITTLLNNMTSMLIKICKQNNFASNVGKDRKLKVTV